MVIESNLLKEKGSSANKNKYVEKEPGQTHQERTTEPTPKVEKKKIHVKIPWAKSAILMVLTLLSSFLSWHLLSSLLGMNFLGDKRWIEYFYQDLLASLVFTFLAFFLMISLVAVSSMLIRPKWLNTINLAIAALIYFVFFGFSLYSSTAFVLLFLSFLFYSLRIGHETGDHINFSVHRSMRFGLGWLVAFLLIVISLSYFQIVTLQNKSMDRFNNALVSYAAEIMNRIFTAKLDGYDADMTLDEFIVKFGTENLADSLLKKPEGGGPLSMLEGLGEIFSPEQKKEIEEMAEAEVASMEQAMINQLRDEFVAGLGIEATGQESMRVIVRRMVATQYVEYLSPYDSYIPTMLAFSLYFILQVFSFIYIALIKLITIIIFSILRLVRFVKIEEVEVKAERALL